MSPLKYLSNATLYFLEAILECTRSISPPAVIAPLFGLAVVIAMLWIEGPHTSALESIRRVVLWYGHWFVLGAIATTAVGPASKTLSDP